MRHRMRGLGRAWSTWGLVASLLGILVLAQGSAAAQPVGRGAARSAGHAAAATATTATTVATMAPAATAAPVDTAAPLATAVTPVNGLSVPIVERQLLAVVSAVESTTALSSTSGSSRSDLLGRLGRIAGQLQMAEALSRQLDNGNNLLDLLLQSKVDTLASIDKIGSDLQINLDQLEVNVNATVNANVDASVHGISVTVSTSADQIQADLGAKADHLLVDITADLSVIKVITLDARAHIDAQRLAVTLHALVTKLTLDLAAVLKDLKVLAKANVTAALAAEARLRADITAQIDGVRAQVLASLDSRIDGQQAALNRLQSQINSLLSSASDSLTAIQNQL